MRKMMMATLAVAAFSCVTSGALRSAEPVGNCGDLSVSQCALLRSTVDRWNQKYGEQFEIVDFRSIGKADGEALDRLYGYESSSRALSIDPQTGSLTVFTIGELLSGNPDKEAVEVDRSRILRFRQSFSEVVRITWSAGGESFTTDALVGDYYPYMIDTMIMSILIAVQPEYSNKDAIRCDDYSIYFINYIEVGRYFTNFYSTTTETPFDGVAHSCYAIQGGYNNFGAISYGKSDVLYSSGRCMADVRMAFTSPFASVKVEVPGLGVTFSGLGGGWVHDARCELPN
ncbi:MAG: hypothetical protein R3D56_07515 [Paracoccaceae bacterium]|jgi:hypothetical protein